MMTNPTEVIDGYIRAQAGLRLLDSAVVTTVEDPMGGYFDLLTEDGRLRLKITYSAAEDLLIDLKQFLLATPPTAIA